MPTHRPIDRHLSRRYAIRLAAGAAATAVLAACGDTASTTPTPATVATRGATVVMVAPIAATGVATTPPTAVITIPPTNTKLPTEKVDLHWVDSAGEKLPFLKAYFAAYQQAHPNIAVQYEGLPFTEIAKVIHHNIVGFAIRPGDDRRAPCRTHDVTPRLTKESRTSKIPAKLRNTVWKN